MSDTDKWWKAHGSPFSGERGNQRWKCGLCGEDFTPKGGAFGKHLSEKHGLGPSEDPLPPSVVDVEEEGLKAVGAGMTRDQYKAFLLDRMQDKTLQGPAVIAAAKLYGETEGYLGDVPEKDLAEKEKVWRVMHEKALGEVRDVRLMILHEMRNPVVRGEMVTLLEEAEKE